MTRPRHDHELACRLYARPDSSLEVESKMNDRSQAVIDSACENLRHVAQTFTPAEIEQAEAFLAAELSEGFGLVDDVREIAHELRMPCDLLSLIRWSMGIYENEPTYAGPRVYEAGQTEVQKKW